jgi:hypothetical protein
MEFRIGTAAIVFLGSYFPLSLILFAQNFQYPMLSRQFCWTLRQGQCEIPLGAPIFSISMVALTLFCLIVTIFSLNIIKPTQDIEVVSAKYIPTDLMNYTLPYIVSFMSIEYSDTGKFVGFVVFLLWIFWISHRSGQIILNPVLIALSWRMYEVEYKFPGSDAKQSGKALAHGHLTAGPFKQSLVQAIQIIKP